ncbi:MAG: tetratricopeptide repeat protein [Myxococcota bacterium]|nr:tetratricopeptide repeat protein [Myxococcota bacterium]
MTPCARGGTSPVRSVFIAVALCLAAQSWAGCSPGADRANHHLERADEFFAENRGREALLELHNAALLRPDDAGIALRVAEASLANGFAGDAVDFYRDALTLEPENTQTALKLARLLLEIDLDAARTQIGELMQTDPRNAQAWLLLARADLIEHDSRAAMVKISNARSIDPNEPEIDHILALAYETRGREALARNPMATPSPRVTESILRAYDRYLAKGGDNPLLGYLGRARALARLPNRREEALEAFEIALEKTRENGSTHERTLVAQEIVRFGRRNEASELTEKAARRWIEISEHDLGAWRALIGPEIDSTREHRRTLYEDLIRTLPELPAAHALYAEFLLESQDYATATEYLEKRLEPGSSDNATLLIGIADIQARSGRLRDAGNVLGRLKAEFPDLPETWLALGKHQILAEDNEAAVESLKTALGLGPTPEAYRALARAEQQRGRFDQALEATNQSFALESPPHPNGLRLRAQIMNAMKDYRGVANSLLRLHRQVRLSPREELSLALSYYDRKTPGIGRKILLQLLERDDVEPQAFLEFARHNSDLPQHRPAVREHLNRALGNFPDNFEILEAVTELDMADGQEERARARLDRTIEERSWLGRPYVIRAKLFLELGEFVAARDNAELAARLDPSTRDEAYDIMTIAYLNDGNLPGLVEAMEGRGKERGISPDRMGLLGRLNLATGNIQRALELYENAIGAGSQLLFVKNDLAYLLANLGGDLDRALSLAQAASDTPGSDLSTVDTLGYVYLKRGQPDVAVWQFRQAASEADPPVPDYFYHLGLALFDLGKSEQAREALEEALGLDPNFGEAETARRLLEELGNAPSEPETPGA